MAQELIQQNSKNIVCGVPESLNESLLQKEESRRGILSEILEVKSRQQPSLLNFEKYCP